MAIAVKICGVSAPEALAAAAQGGARFAGFVFYPPSPRHLAAEQALALARQAPAALCKVGVFVDPSDDQIAAVAAALDMVQLHGSESPARVAAIKARFGLPVVKAIKVATEDDLPEAQGYAEVADWLMFDAKPPKGAATLPGGNALAFDWQILAGGRARKAAAGRPWMLSGGLTVENVREAIALSGAQAVDVSSGVEDKPGVKSIARIAAFLEAVRGAPYGRPGEARGEAVPGQGAAR